MDKPGNFGKGDTLTPVQLERLVGAVGVLMAKQKAHEDGWSWEQIHAMTWEVKVEPLDDQG